MSEAVVPVKRETLEEVAKVLEATGYAHRVKRRDDGSVDWISMSELRLGRAAW